MKYKLPDMLVYKRGYDYILRSFKWNVSLKIMVTHDYLQCQVNYNTGLHFKYVATEDPVTL